MNRPAAAPVSLRIVPGLQRFRPLVSALALACTALVAGPAQAVDDIGAQGRLTQITIHAAGSDEFSAHHGKILVKPGGKKAEVYTWGGTACPASKLTDAQVATLESAFHNRHRTLIRPRYKPGDVKDTRCLVGFELTGG